MTFPPINYREPWTDEYFQLNKMVCRACGEKVISVEVRHESYSSHPFTLPCGHSSGFIPAPVKHEPFEVYISEPEYYLAQLLTKIKTQLEILISEYLTNVYLGRPNTNQMMLYITNDLASIKQTLVNFDFVVDTK
jgi:hypothetical protein